MDDNHLDKAIEIAMDRVAQHGDDPRRVQDPYRTLAIVASAQGVIDNGGLGYFFENDWPGCPPYSLFSHALRSIGAEAEARAIEELVTNLSSPHPEQDRAQRMRDLDALQAELERADEACTSDVWALLQTYVQAHSEAF